jgi:hypothetical protein
MTVCKMDFRDVWGDRQLTGCLIATDAGDSLGAASQTE